MILLQSPIISSTPLCLPHQGMISGFISEMDKIERPHMKIRLNVMQVRSGLPWEIKHHLSFDVTDFSFLTKLNLRLTR